MKTIRFNRNALIAILAISAALLFAGCGNSAQEKAYAQAEKVELQMTAENSAAVVAEYKQVIALQPGSEWARKAEARLEAIEAKLKAEELHKSVFQEHGID